VLITQISYIEYSNEGRHIFHRKLVLSTCQDFELALFKTQEISQLQTGGILRSDLRLQL
jgi:hypothetical protein